MTINLPDEEVAALQAKAAAEGLSLEEWLRRLAGFPERAGTLGAAANIVLEEMGNVPADIMAGMPADGASEHDHYIYGWTKKEA